MRLVLALEVVLVAVVIAGCSDDRKAGTPIERAPPVRVPIGEDTPPQPVGDNPDYIEIPANRPIGPPMAKHAAAAIAAGKKPFAYLHAGWCEPCKVLDKTRTSDPAMKDAFAGTVILALDMERVPEQQLMDQSLPFGTIPVFYRLDAEGIPSGDSLDGSAWKDNTVANMAPALKTFFSASKP
jgi:hypothetical protein